MLVSDFFFMPIAGLMSGETSKRVFPEQLHVPTARRRAEHAKQLQ